MNIPYVKEYKDGVLQNPIKGSYLNRFNNRKARAETRNRIWGGKSPRFKFMGNGKNFSLTINGKYKYARRIQEIISKVTGQIKRIEHYDLKGVNY